MSGKVGDQSCIKYPITPPPRRPINVADSPNRWSNLSEVRDEDEKFQVNLDVRNFEPEDLSVNSVGNRLLVEGRQMAKRDGNGYTSREYRLDYVLPRRVHMAEIRPEMSETGVLKVEAPKFPSPKPSPTKK